MSFAENISIDLPVMTYNSEPNFNSSVILDVTENASSGSFWNTSGSHTPDSQEDLDQYTLYPTIKQPVHMIVIYSIAYSIVFLLGIIGNCLVVSVVFRNARMHSVTNYFIVNLAIADILVCLFNLPITLLSNLYTGWRFGAVMCKVTPYLQGVAVSASVNTLTAIALDRYLAICHILSFKINHRACRFMICFIWLEACGIMVPWAVYYQQKEFSSPVQTLFICNQYWPTEEWEKGYFLGVIFLTCYTIPLVFISCCYTMIGCRVSNRNAPGIANVSPVIQKSKVKVLKMMIVVVILFGFSWLPLYAVQVRLYFGGPLNSESSEFTLLTSIIMPISQWLGASNSCVNPIIYCFFSKKFRHGFKEMFHCNKRTNPQYTNRNNSAIYRSCHEGNGHTYYTSVRSTVLEKRSPTRRAHFKDRVTFV